MMMSEEWITIIESAEGLTDMFLSSEAIADYRKAYNESIRIAVLVKEIQAFTEMKERI